jgi:hypothetical protein
MTVIKMVIVNQKRGRMVKTMKNKTAITKAEEEAIKEPGGLSELLDQAWEKMKRIKEITEKMYNAQVEKAA